MPNFNTPILFLVFNRPNTTKQVFEKIREARPPRLYIAADGPRESRKGEEKKCKQVREIVTNVDWDCEVNTLFREVNLGCKSAVSSGIDWFFKHEEMGIILEDDCLPDATFFRFCEELLLQYIDDERVMTISGNNFQPKRRTENSYYFSKYMHCWGWASWRRAWNHFDLKMKDWPKLKRKKFLNKLFNTEIAKNYWEQILDKVYSGKIDSWAYIWTYSIWKEHGFNIIPEENLVCNIGFGEEGTHTKSINSKSANMETKPIIFPLKHPEEINTLKKADKFTQKHHFQTPFYKRFFNKINGGIRQIISLSESMNLKLYLF